MQKAKGKTHLVSLGRLGALENHRQQRLLRVVAVECVAYLVQIEAFLLRFTLQLPQAFVLELLSHCRRKVVQNQLEQSLLRIRVWVSFSRRLCCGDLLVAVSEVSCLLPQLLEVPARHFEALHQICVLNDQ